MGIVQVSFGGDQQYKLGSKVVRNQVVDKVRRTLNMAKLFLNSYVLRLEAFLFICNFYSFDPLKFFSVPFMVNFVFDPFDPLSRNITNPKSRLEPYMHYPNIQQLMQ